MRANWILAGLAGAVLSISAGAAQAQSHSGRRYDHDNRHQSYRDDHARHDYRQHGRYSHGRSYGHGHAHQHGHWDYVPGHYDRHHGHWDYHPGEYKWHSDHRGHSGHYRHNR